jgi:hypothetical protein
MCMQANAEKNIHDVFDKLMAQQAKESEQKRREEQELMAEWIKLEKKVMALKPGASLD